jgi:hypothetical protein
LDPSDLPAPQTHLRWADDLVSRGLRLDDPLLARVQRAFAEGAVGRAADLLLSYYETRSDPVDPAVVRWKASGAAQEAVSFQEAADDLSSWRVGGKLDWAQGNAPPKERWHEYWQRNRLHMIDRWAPAALTSSSPVLRNAVARVFLDWFHAQPAPELPVRGWWEPAEDGFGWREFEVAERCRRLVTLFLASRDWKDVPVELHIALLVSIHQHADYLWSHYLHNGFAAGNHQALHSAPLVAAGVLLPEWKHARAWKETGLRILEEHLKSDVSPDGVQLDNSPSYHALVLWNWLDPVSVLASAGEKPPSATREVLQRMADFLLHATAPNGVVASFNDCWDIPTGEIRRAAAQALDRPDLTVLEDGDTGNRPVLPPTGRAFEHSGIAIMRSSWNRDAIHVVLDATRDLSCHWHAGKPNLIVQAGDQLLAIDPQLGSYDSAAIDGYFRAARAHNTVLVNGRGEEKQPSPRPGLTAFHAGEQIAVARATTDGFESLATPVSFERTVVFLMPDIVFVRDVLESRGRNRYQWLLHLVPQDPRVDRSSGTLTTRTGGPFELACSPAPGTERGLAGPSIERGLIRNMKKLVDGGAANHWVPRESGRPWTFEVEAPYGVWTRKGRGRVTFEFVLQVLRPGQSPAALRREPGPGTAYRIESGEKVATIVLDDTGGRAFHPERDFVLASSLGVAVRNRGDLDPSP